MVQVIYTRGLRRAEGPITEDYDYEYRGDGSIVFHFNLNRGDIVVRETHGPDGYYCEETWKLISAIPLDTPVRLEGFPSTKKESRAAPVVI